MLAKQVTVMCGSEQLPWDFFRRFLLELRNSILPVRVLEKFEYQTVRESPAMSIVEQTTLSNNERTLWRLLSTTQGLRCTESRDRVYALLGVAIAGSENIGADYKMTMTILLNLVLKRQHQLQGPQTVEEILEQCEQLTDIFQLPFGLMFAPVEQQEQLFGLQEFAKARLLTYKHKGFVLLRWASLYDHEAVEELLFENGTIDSRTSLYFAAKHGDTALVALLLGTGKVQSHWRDNDGQTALHWAASRGHEAIVKLLLHHGKSGVDGEDEDGRTALHWAAMHGHASTCPSLLG